MRSELEDPRLDEPSRSFAEQSEVRSLPPNTTCETN